MQREPVKSVWPKRLIKWAFVGEGLLFIASFAVFRRLLHDREARFYCQENYPFILQQFYWVLSLDPNPASNTLHLTDKEIWQQREKSK